MTLGNCVLPHPYPSDFLAEYFYQKEVSHKCLVRTSKTMVQYIDKMVQRHFELAPVIEIFYKLRGIKHVKMYIIRNVCI